ncbi:MAG: GDSL-type esterase/lipase family protein [Candidatus Cloacimonas sp.]|jgi:hypothetical protein|nr:GDSL-type esterase/lipase family protein [Candidatus Cloacimonas sp.]
MLAFVLMLSYSSAAEIDDTDYLEELFSPEEYPSDMDTLEEFIQSYYLLLDSNEYLTNFKFIKADKNQLEADAKALRPFYEKLLELRSGLRNRVSIYQIGDSHIQSGYFSGTARSSLQKYYGNAGRGLIFPLRLAGTNQPDDYRISSTSGFSRINGDRGICGYSMNADDGAALEISTNNFFGLDNSFNKLSIISSQTGMKPELKSIENCEKVSLDLGDYHYNSLSWADPKRNIGLKFSGESSRLYGLMLERQDPGLLYHAMGLNGAGFYNLTDSPRIFEQVGLLNPDLIIISLGTNDAQGNYRNEQFVANLKKFMSLLRKGNPDTPVLFTLPPDSNKRGKHNADLAKVEKSIIDFARDNNCAWWDLGKVMGGRGSVVKWRSQQMASKDLMHFTPKGYMLQGYLFYQAMINSYKEFSEKPSGKE